MELMEQNDYVEFLQGFPGYIKTQKDSKIAMEKFSFIFAFINISSLRQAAKRSSFVN